jgi:hypothetical protein
MNVNCREIGVEFLRREALYPAELREHKSKVYCYQGFTGPLDKLCRLTQSIPTWIPTYCLLNYRRSPRASFCLFEPKDLSFSNKIIAADLFGLYDAFDDQLTHSGGRYA